MIKGLLFLILAAFALSYGWGWYVHVKQGPMDVASFTQYYEREATDQFSKLMQLAQKSLNFAKKPLPTRSEFEFPK